MQFWYLATPYSKFPGGINEAFVSACKQSAILVEAKIPHFCPIAHTHMVAILGGIDPLDHNIWLPVDKPLMHAACGIIVCKLPTWEKSYGMAKEMEHFTSANKPRIYMEPGVAPNLSMFN